MNKSDVTKTRDQILNTALPNVPFDGWVWETILSAAIESGKTEQIAHAVFPNKMIDVLDGFADLADRKMLAMLSDIDENDLPIRTRIRTALVKRFEYLQQHKDAVRQSAAFWAMPMRKITAAKTVWRTADVIWIWAGDDSTDYNRYTKRTLLSGIIVSTTLAWLDNSSEDFEQTKAFLDRRIENVMKLGKTIGKLKAFKQKVKA